MASIIIGLALFVIIEIFNVGSILSITVVQSFILLAIFVYIPQLYENFHKQDIWKLSWLSGISVSLSFQLDQGALAFLFVTPWLLSSLIVLYKKPPEFGHEPPKVLVWSSQLFFVASALVLLISRLGLQPIGFSHQIIELTVIHFHYAGIMIPLFTSKISNGSTSKTRDFLQYLIGMGTALVAVGISIGKFIPIFGVIAVLMFTIPLILLSVAVIKGDYNNYLRIAHSLLIISICLAIYYAFGVSSSINTISISDMITTHGLINGLGFVPLSLIGWHSYQS